MVEAREVAQRGVVKAGRAAQRDEFVEVSDFFSSQRDVRQRWNVHCVGASASNRALDVWASARRRSDGCYRPVLVGKQSLESSCSLI